MSNKLFNTIHLIKSLSIFLTLVNLQNMWKLNYNSFDITVVMPESCKAKESTLIFLKENMWLLFLFYFLDEFSFIYFYNICANFYFYKFVGLFFHITSSTISVFFIENIVTKFLRIWLLTGWLPVCINNSY